MHVDYVLFRGGARIGWSRGVFDRLRSKNEEPLRSQKTQSYFMLGRSSDNAWSEWFVESETLYKDDWEPIRSTETIHNGDQVRHYEVQWGKVITIRETIDHGRTMTTDIDTVVLGLPVLDENASWRFLMEGGVRPGARITFFSINRSRHSLVQTTWTLGGRVKHRTEDGGTFEGIAVDKKQGGVTLRDIYDSDGTLVYGELGGGFTAERTTLLPDPFEIDRALVSNHLKTSIAVERLKGLAQVELEVRLPAAAQVEDLLDSNPYQLVKRYGWGYAMLLSAQRPTEAALQAKYPMENFPSSAVPYLSATPLCQSEDEELVRVAELLVRDQVTALGAARQLCTFVGTVIRLDFSRTAEASAKQAYTDKRGDCTEHATLFTALARAARIPARRVSGLVYVIEQDPLGGGIRGAFYPHAWAEVWIGDWVPVDTMTGDLGTDARYILLAQDEPRQTYGIGRAGQISQLGERIEFVINAYTHDDGSSWLRSGSDRRFP